MVKPAEPLGPAAPAPGRRRLLSPVHAASADYPNGTTVTSTDTGEGTRWDGDAATGRAGTGDVTAAARGLVAGLSARPWGEVSPSVYETGRLVALAPWLPGHARRVEFLLAAQRADGGWGGPGGYTLVPSLSAADALLAVLDRASGGREGGGGPAERPAVARAAERGLGLLRRLLADTGAAAVPDTPAADIIALSLVESIGARAAARPTAVSGPRGDDRLPAPAGFDGRRLAAFRALLGAGAAVPDKLLHALEVGGESARGLRAVRPSRSGTVGASPAATAAWLGPRPGPDSGGPARRFLEAVIERHGGPVPCGIPITAFERAWALTHLLRAGIAVPVPADVVASLRPALGPAGTPAGDGLPPDADTTAAALYALGLLGLPCRPDGLWPYRLDAGFCTWQGEDGFSVTTNAHVLEAFGQYLVQCPDAPRRYRDVVSGLSAVLREHQRDDGAWADRWHASPYYATACCALALRRFAGPEAAAAVRAAVRWVIGTQRPDGSWGRWAGTAEETAYAVHVLALAGTGAPGAGAALARGLACLRRLPDPAGGPALWHDKDLYRPAAIVRAAVLAAVHLARRASGGDRGGPGTGRRNAGAREPRGCRPGDRPVTGQPPDDDQTVRKSHKADDFGFCSDN